MHLVGSQFAFGDKRMLRSVIYLFEMCLISLFMHCLYRNAC